MNKNELNLKNNKGFTTTDIVVAVVIIMLFIGIITTVFYNYYLSIAAKNRNSIATNCTIDVIENIKKMNYDEINTENVNSLIEQFVQDGTIPQGYNVIPELKKYNETVGNTEKLDIIKTLKVKVEYTVSNKQEQIEISTIITK